jgi:hypothetical protein
MGNVSSKWVVACVGGRLGEYYDRGKSNGQMKEKKKKKKTEEEE